ncbi:MAG: hypothetical protein HUJ54_02295 [Erysipelotrichaceae bacterium]|nr:hypothetical protein [Erysipelotrichaceae bacterium]
MKESSRKGFRRAVSIVLIVSMVTVYFGSGIGIWFKISMEAVGNPDEDLILTVAKGETQDQLIKDLADKKLIKSELAASLYCLFHPVSPKPGCYRVNKGMTTQAILAAAGNEYTNEKNTEKKT